MHNLKLAEENKKLSVLIDKVISSYKPESHIQFLEAIEKDSNEFSTNQVREEDEMISRNKEASQQAINTTGNPNRMSSTAASNSKSKVIPLNFDHTSEKYFVELKSNFIFKQLKEKIRELSNEIKQKDDKILELKENVKAITVSKLEKDYKAKIDECLNLKKENHFIKTLLMERDEQLGKAASELDELRHQDRRYKQKIEDMNLKINILESDSFKKNQTIRESKEKLENCKYQLSAFKSQMAHQEKLINSVNAH